MARDVNGNYSLPVGTIVASGDTVLPSQHNPAMNDLAASMTNSLARTGAGGMLADLNLGGFSLTNVASAGFSGTVTTVNAVITGTATFHDAQFRVDYATFPFLNFDTNDYVSYVRGINQFNFVIGGVTEASIDSNNLTLPTNGLLLQGGNITLQNTDALEKRVQFTQTGGRNTYFFGTGTAFGLADSVNGIIWSFSLTTGVYQIPVGVTAPTVAVDSGGYMTTVGGNFVLNGDTNDYIVFNRAANKWMFYIGGVAQMSIDATGTLRVAGPVLASTAP